MNKYFRMEENVCVCVYDGINATCHAVVNDTNKFDIGNR